MKLYHGSPKKFSVLKPKQAKGIFDFENKNAIYCVSTFLYVSLYVIGKSLKGKTLFVVMEDKLVILGDFFPQEGYVYEVESKNFVIGPGDQYAVLEEVKPIKVTKVKPDEYKDNVVWVKTKKELLSYCEDALLSFPGSRKVING